MARKRRFYFKGTHAWPVETKPAPVSHVIKMYEKGFAGTYLDPDERDAHIAGMSFKTLSDAAHRYNWADSGKGQLCLPYTHIEKHFPGSIPGPAQQVGDCVSHSQKNANLGTYAYEISAGLPDEVTGKIEGAPDISLEGLKNGAFSTEAIYWYRGHGGHGWYCGAAARVSKTTAGLVIRQAYEGFDLTKYSGRNTTVYGSRKPTESVTNQLNRNLIRESTMCKTREEVRDALRNGKFITSCGSEGFSNKRDQNGVSGRQGSWAHAMAYIGCDDRPWAWDTYGDMLVLVLNSWGIWNSGSRTIHGTDLLIPNGAFWTPYKNVARREAIAMAGAFGWEAPNLDPFVSVLG